MKHSGLFVFLVAKRFAICTSIVLLAGLFGLTKDDPRTTATITANTRAAAQPAPMPQASAPGMSLAPANISANTACLAQPLDHWLNAALHITSHENNASTNALPCIRAHLWHLEDESIATHQPFDNLPNPGKLLFQRLSEYQLSRLIVLIAMQPEAFAEHWHSPAVLVYSPVALLEPVFELLHAEQAPPQAENIAQVLLDALAQQAIQQFPDNAVSILLRNQYTQLNLIVVHALLNPETSIGNTITLPQLSQLWPALAHADSGKYRAWLLQQVIARYLTANRTDTLLYLAGYFQFTENRENTAFPRKFNLPNAINTLLAWELDQLHYLNAEHYDADSELVIRGVSSLLAENPNRVFSRLAQISPEPLRNKIMASVVQSPGFFNLEQAQFAALLRQQPSDLAEQLANAYVLQFAHLSESEYQQSIAYIAGFVTLKEAL